MAIQLCIVSPWTTQAGRATRQAEEVLEIHFWSLEGVGRGMDGRALKSICLGLGLILLGLCMELGEVVLRVRVILWHHPGVLVGFWPQISGCRDKLQAQDTV